VNELAVAELRLGHLDQARRWAAQLKGATGAADAWRNDQADTLLALADLYSGRSTIAETALRRLLAALLRDEGGVSVGTEQLRRVHAEALLRLGKVEEAEAELHTSLNNLLRLLGPNHYRPAAARLVLGCALARRGKVPQALVHWSAASEVLQRELGPQHPYALAAMAYVELGSPIGSAEQRRQLASRVRAELGWQDGASELARLLDEPGPTRHWAGLAPVL
jgi:tetratricopeptide (TPR) repeat protein